MNKNLERLREIDFKPLNPYDVKLLKKVLKDFEKRIKKLEQAQTYFPIEYTNQTGGVDNIITNDGQKLLIDVNYKEGDD